MFRDGLAGAGIGIGGAVLGAQVNLVVAGSEGDGSAGIEPLFSRTGLAVRLP
jgi:hypothetical protein